MCAAVLDWCRVILICGVPILLNWNSVAAVVALAPVIAQAGVAFDSPVALSADDGPRSVIAADIDGDLDLDLLVTCPAGGSWSIYRNQGAGSFAAPTEFSPGDSNLWTLAVGDADCDGDLDVFVLSASGSFRRYINDGSGNMLSSLLVTTAAIGRELDIADVDNDGDLDVVVTSQTATVAVHLNNGLGGYTTRVDTSLPEFPNTLALGDLTGDGVLDLVVARPLAAVDNLVYMHAGIGNGTFSATPTALTSFEASSVELMDMDADGDLDLVHLWQIGGPAFLRVCLNNGLASFSCGPVITLGNNGQHPFLADFNGDGAIDVMTHTITTFRLFLNNGSGVLAEGGTFSTGVGSQTEQAVAADIDRDGDVDVVVANRSADTVGIHFQTGNAGGPDDSVDVPPIVISGFSHDFDDSRGGSNDRMSDSVDFTASGSSLYTNNSFIASIQEGNEIVVRAEAAAGFRFVVIPPSDPAWGASTGFGLAAYWLETGLTNIGTPVPASAQGTHTFVNLLGTAPAAVDRRDRVTCDGRRVQVSRYFAPTEPFSFTALELRFPVTNAPPDQLKVYTAVEGGQFGTETEGEEMPDLTVMSLQPLSSPTTVALPPIVIQSLAHSYSPNGSPPGTSVVFDSVHFPDGPGQGDAPGFTVEYGPDDELLVRIEPQPGMVFRLNALPGATTTQIVTSLNWYVNTSFMPVAFYPAEITWVGLKGATPVEVTNTARVAVDGSALQVGFRMNVAGTIEFDAIELRFPTNGNPFFELPLTYYPLGRSSTVDNPFGISRVEATASGIGLADATLLEMIPIPPDCPADANGDNAVNGADLSVLLSQFGQNVVPGTGGDTNGDGIVNGADLSVLLSNFGAAC